VTQAPVLRSRRWQTARPSSLTLLAPSTSCMVLRSTRTWSLSTVGIGKLPSGLWREWGLIKTKNEP